VNSDRQETSIDKVHSDWNGKCQPPDSNSNRNWNRNGNRIEIEPLALQLPFYVVGPKNQTQNKFKYNATTDWPNKCGYSRKMLFRSRNWKQVRCLSLLIDWLNVGEFMAASSPSHFSFSSESYKSHLSKLPLGEWQAWQIVTH